jgi:hypothetical protein
MFTYNIGEILPSLRPLSQIIPSFLSNTYHYMIEYLNPEKHTKLIEADLSENYTPIILTPMVIFINESEIHTRENIFNILHTHRSHFSIRFILPKYYSSYLLCHLFMDILDILSNELFLIQTKIEFIMEKEFKNYFIKELKTHIKNNIPFIQKNKILPIYAKFIETPDYHVEYMVSFIQRFHILLIKEVEDSLTIQRIHFTIDL